MYPAPEQSGTIITFYSYKGGTGRTMALANTAYLFAQRFERTAQRVLMLDWDLEAPGLHKFFSGALENRASQPGIIEYFHALKQLLEKREEFYEKVTAPEGWNVLDKELPLDDYLLKDVLQGVDLIKAGNLDTNYADYSALVHSFNWVEFYERFGLIMDVFRDLLIHKYAYTLVDSRTGLNDISGICTMLLPEKLVAVFTPNDQSLEGVISLVERAVQYRQSSRDFRPLAVFPLPSRIELAEKDLRTKWRTRYQHDFEQIFCQIYSMSTCDLTSYFDEVQVPHMSYYAYGESIAVREERSEALSLSRAYEEFFRRLLEMEVAWEQLDSAQVSSVSQTKRSVPETPVEYIDFNLQFSSTSQEDFYTLSLQIPPHQFNGSFDRLQSPPLAESVKERMIPTGKQLFGMVFKSSKSRSAYRQYLEENQHFSMKIDISYPRGINAFPWELLYDPNQGPLALEAPIVRILPQPSSGKGPIVQPPLKVLLTCATPSSLEPLDFESEASSIQRALSHLGNDVKLTLEPHLTIQKLLTLLQEQNFHLLHFAGHSGLNDQGIGALSLEDDEGNLAILDAPGLRFMLNDCDLRLVVLSVGSNAAIVSDLFLGVAPALIRAHIPAIVMVQDTISPQGAKVFVTDFYRALGQGLPIEASMTEARKALVIATGFGQPDWASPVLYTSGGPVRKLFDFPL
jgi:MinD-like ATPase involved in chromosome partitioning or flagellar assembly